MKLDNMSREELQSLQKQVTVALKNYDERKKREAQSKLEAMAKEMGYSLNDFAGGKKRLRAASPPKIWRSRLSLRNAGKRDADPRPFFISEAPS